MGKTNTLSMITGGKVERAATVDLGDLKTQLAGIEARVGELDARLGTLSADMKIKQADAARARNFGDKARARGHMVTLEAWREERNRLITQREELLREAAAIRRRMADTVTENQKAAAAGADLELRPAVEKLLKTFEAFCEADDSYRQLKNSFVRHMPHWPNSMMALTPWQRNQFRQSLESYLKKGKK